MFEYIEKIVKSLSNIIIQFNDPKQSWKLADGIHKSLYPGSSRISMILTIAPYSESNPTQGFNLFIWNSLRFRGILNEF